MPSLIHSRIRAPQEDGAALIDPPLAQIPQLVENNRELSKGWDQQAGIPFRRWQKAARSELVEIYQGQAQPGWELANYPSPFAAPSPEGPFIMSGHQPALFHPGVWLKNFLLSAIGQMVGGAAVNLIVESDIVAAPAIAVPSGTPASPRLVQVPIDVATEPEPWGGKSIHNQELFSSFASRVKDTYSFPYETGRDLLIDRVWDEVQHIQESYLEQWGSQAPKLLSLAWCLAGARHRVELKLGLKTFEAPQSLVYGALFGDFADHLLLRAREFREVYNAALAEYRLVNGIRSRAHPVPELEAEGQWIEAPFWIWTLDNFRRRRVFVRITKGGFELTDREGLYLPQGWKSWDEPHRNRSPRFAPRALVTTMYARLVLSDLFIHGIGGAKYDELTDLIIRRFFGIEPPAYVTATATFRLPIERPHVSIDNVLQSSQRIRALRYRPEAFVGDPLVTQDATLASKLSALAAEKRTFLAAHDLRRCSPDVFDRLNLLNLTMNDLLTPVERMLRAQHQQLIADLRRSQLLGSREFSFVLFPSEILPARLLDLCKVLS